MLITSACTSGGSGQRSDFFFSRFGVELGVFSESLGALLGVELGAIGTIFPRTILTPAALNVLAISIS